MNPYINIIISLISVLAGFLATYLFVKRKPNKSYEPDYINAQIELQNANFDTAIIYFNDVLKNIDPSNPFFISSLVGISESYIGKGDTLEAKKYIVKAIEEANKTNNSLQKIQLQKILKKIEAA